jgi:hypothetical protein
MVRLPRISSGDNGQHSSVIFLHCDSHYYYCGISLLNFVIKQRGKAETAADMNILGTNEKNVTDC